MNEKWYWIELIGFDRTLPDYGVKDFTSRVSGDIHGVSLLLCSIDFINLYSGIDKEEPLMRSVCSYGGHPFNEERNIQNWTNYELKGLIDALHENGLKVILSIFDLYKYADENGNIQNGIFIKEHPELKLYSSVKSYHEDSIFIMKRFCDGRSYSDFYISQLTRVLNDYGFDGYHFADGLSSPRFTIQRSDFGDDIAEQYVHATNAALPEEISGKCDDDKNKHLARYKYIMENQRYEFTRFIADWFADFYKRLANALLPFGKQIIFNIAWARDPFEALYRYGVDYGMFEQDGISGMMVEDVGSMMPLYGQMGLAGFKVPLKDRTYANYALFLTQMAIKAHVPSLKQWNMTTLKDTQEDWNLIDAAPYELHKLIVRRNNTWFADRDGFTRSSNGAFYCLSDGIPKDKWDKVKQWEDFADLGNVSGTMGLTAIWEPNILNSELRQFIDERKPSVNQVLEIFTYAGIPINSMVRIENVIKYNSPVIAVNTELYPQSSLDILEEYKNAPMILIGFKNPLKRAPECVVEECKDGFKAYFYNCGLSSKDASYLNLNKKQKTFSAYDKNDGTWTVPLDFVKPDRKFVIKVKKLLDSLYLYPVVLNNCDCHMTTYYTQDNKAIVLITNDSFSAEDVQIHFPCNLTSVRSLSKPQWYKCRFDDQSAYLHINNRAMEVLEITFAPLNDSERKKSRMKAYKPAAFTFEPEFKG